MSTAYGSPNKIAWTIRISRDRLEEVAKEPERFYQPFPKRKPGGKVRIIDNPTGELKTIQTRLNVVILRNLPLPACMIGGVRGKDPLDHPRYHVGKKVVVTIDVKECFPSITHRQIFQVFRHQVQCSPTVARLLTRLSTYKGHLPLGSPTSTTLANLVIAPIVLEIERLVGDRGLKPSQFVDDTAMSGDHLDNQLVSEVVKIFSRRGLRIGRKKIKVMRSGEAQVVTGKTVNTRTAIPVKRRRKVRAALNRLSRTLPTEAGYGKLYRSARGRVAEVERLHPSEGQRLITQLSTLSSPSAKRATNDKLEE